MEFATTSASRLAFRRRQFAMIAEGLPEARDEGQERFCLTKDFYGRRGGIS